ncbi:MAG: Fic family protein [Candidatus Dormibacteraceae bacterium]
MYVGIRTDPNYPLGEFRGSSASRALQACDVAVRNVPGVMAERVAAELRRFQRSIAQRTVKLDAACPNDASDAATIAEIAELAAFAHGEWVRIHPFANGNGRTARILCNWILLRHGLPPVLRLRPRPQSADYARAAAQSMARIAWVKPGGQFRPSEGLVTTSILMIALHSWPACLAGQTLIRRPEATRFRRLYRGRWFQSTAAHYSSCLAFWPHLVLADPSRLFRTDSLMAACSVTLCRIRERVLWPRPTPSLHHEVDAL